MSEIQGYSAFARYYDSLTGNVDYPGRAARLDAIIRKYKTTDGKLLLDLACGTGSMCEALAKRGYDVLGVDCSPEMLGCAMEKKLTSGLPIQYLCQDMRRLDMFGTIDVTICALDSLNHLSNFEGVKRVFERVSLFSNDGAIFIFDVNTIYKHKNILADNIFIYDTPQVYCIWENSYSQEDNSVDIDLTFFENNNENYRRYEENFSEIAFPLEMLRQALIETGFDIVAEYEYPTHELPTEKSEKITFVARKAR